MSQMRVFVSHSHEDTAFCHALVQALRGAGADVWYDEHDMGSGRLGPTIEREVHERLVFVVILSPAALRSQWVEDETRWAYGLLRKDTSRQILPVTAATLSEDDIWLFLRDFKRVEASGLQPFPLEEAVRRTLLALTFTPAGTAPAQTAPQPTQSVDDLVARGAALQDQGNDMEALPLFELATQLAPQSAYAWFRLAYTLNRLRRWSEALDACERTVALHPDNDLAWGLKGVALQRLERHEDALVAYEHALALDPNSSRNAYVYAWKGDMLYDMERYGEALAAYGHALALDANNANTWNSKACALSRLKQYSEALAAVDHALALDPNYANAWDTKGEALNRLQRYDEALACLNRALVLDPNLGDAWKNKADTLRALGRTAEAEAAERRTKELEGE